MPGWPPTSRSCRACPLQAPPPISGATSRSTNHGSMQLDHAVLVTLLHGYTTRVSSSRVCRSRREQTSYMCRRLQRQLAALQRAPALQPSAPSFGAAALALRCSLDQALSSLRHAPPQLQPDQPDFGGLSAAEDVSLSASLAAADSLAASHLLDLCCPLLRKGRSALQVKCMCVFKWKSAAEHEAAETATATEWKSRRVH